MDEAAIASAKYWLEVWEGPIGSLMIALVAVGVAYEFVADLIARPYERTLDAAREATLARLVGEAESARVERLKLEEKLAYRRLLEPQRESIASKLLPFAGTRVGILLSAATPEIVLFARDIAAALQDAGWIVFSATRTEPNVMVGLMVEAEPSASDQEHAVGLLLAAALRDENVAVWPLLTAPIGGTFAGKDQAHAIAAPLRINVGHKP